MQFLVTAYDGTDEQAKARRTAARPAHIEGAQTLKDNGNLLIGGAILDEAGQMIGSSLIVEFEDRPALDEWLNNDPYITGDVWQEVTVLPFRVAVKS
jgi:uncharacterized protein YciI